MADDKQEESLIRRLLNALTKKIDEFVKDINILLGYQPPSTMEKVKGVVVSMLGPASLAIIGGLISFSEKRLRRMVSGDKKERESKREAERNAKAAKKEAERDAEKAKHEKGREELHTLKVEREKLINAGILENNNKKKAAREAIENKERDRQARENERKAREAEKKKQKETKTEPKKAQKLNVRQPDLPLDMPVKEEKKPTEQKKPIPRQPENKKVKQEKTQPTKPVESKTKSIEQKTKPSNKESLSKFRKAKPSIHGKWTLNKYIQKTGKDIKEVRGQLSQEKGLPIPNGKVTNPLRQQNKTHLKNKTGLKYKPGQTKSVIAGLTKILEKKKSRYVALKGELNNIRQAKELAGTNASEAVTVKKEVVETIKAIDKAQSKAENVLNGLKEIEKSASKQTPDALQSVIEQAENDNKEIERTSAKIEKAVEKIEDKVEKIVNKPTRRRAGQKLAQEQPKKESEPIRRTTTKSGKELASDADVKSHRAELMKIRSTAAKELKMSVGELDKQVDSLLKNKKIAPSVSVAVKQLNKINGSSGKVKKISADDYANMKEEFKSAVARSMGVFTNELPKGNHKILSTSGIAKFDPDEAEKEDRQKKAQKARAEIEKKASANFKNAEEKALKAVVNAQLGKYAKPEEQIVIGKGKNVPISSLQALEKKGFKLPTSVKPSQSERKDYLPRQLRRIYKYLTHL